MKLSQVESQRDKLTKILIEAKTSVDDQSAGLREELRKTVARHERVQTMKLLNLQLYDLNLSDEATKTAQRYADIIKSLNRHG